MSNKSYDAIKETTNSSELRCLTTILVSNLTSLCDSILFEGMECNLLFSLARLFSLLWVWKAWWKTF